MRREIFEKISREVAMLEGPDGERLIKHVDLWNRNVEFAVEDEVWPRPAVFVEFGVIEWRHARPAPGKRCSMRCSAELSLHVVTDWHVGEPCLCNPHAVNVPGDLSLIGALSYVLTGLRGECFSDLMPLRELSNHDHGELLEEILVMSYRGYMTY
jgi:hypothetical protein